MSIETISVRGKDALVHLDATGLQPDQIALFAPKISDSVTASPLTKSQRPDEVAELITAGNSVIIVDATDPYTLLAYTGAIPSQLRGRPVTLLGGWISYASGFGLEVMKRAAIKAVTEYGTDAFAKVHVMNTPAKKAMRNMGARRVGIGVSSATKNVVFTYNLTEVGRRGL